ncbi:hypothetical protein PVAG01_06108 [Phlyctema vagabunda]|uniref:NADH dehydrogenase [ubiquinone] 1 alpha subcomplex subunit n=1 Tax=Phlyctema vagabunda TaxID=108571 RepID=A0ABR4PF74_9HELO
MAPGPPTALQRAWLRWRSLRLPWRKRFLVGLDLQGNTFWEFHDSLSHKHRMRRIVEYPRSVQLSEVNISPQWHQWLRHTRTDPPTLTEQSQDLVRQRNLKILAAEADRRWAAKPSYLDKPQSQSPLPAMGGAAGSEGNLVSQNLKLNPDGVLSGIGNGLADQNERTARPPPQVRASDANARQPPKKEEKTTEDDPWKKARGGPSEEWQPKAWDGSVNATRRG